MLFNKNGKSVVKKRSDTHVLDAQRGMLVRGTTMTLLHGLLELFFRDHLPHLQEPRCFVNSVLSLPKSENLSPAILPSIYSSLYPFSYPLRTQGSPAHTTICILWIMG